MDGLKPSQRKVLYCALKRKLHEDIKVAQLAGYISEHAAYHHGEQSLCSTIINMAQDFTGSNNINLLEPSGQFGTRLLGGKDPASPRYIFTRLKPDTSLLFPEHHNILLTYLKEDGMDIEPMYYLPTLPLVLINGSKGIGTGFSTDIPCFNPDDIKQNIKNLIEGKPLDPMTPWYQGFKGSIEKISENKWMSYGIVNKINTNTVRITELPLFKWTEDFKKYLDKLETDKKIDTYTNNSDTENIDFEIKMHGLKKMNTQNLIAFFKLSSSISTNNMYLFDKNNVITKYYSAEEILEYYYESKMIHYDEIKTYLISQTSATLNMANAKVLYISAVIDKTLEPFGKSKNEQIELFSQFELPTINDNYDYVFNMRMSMLTQENIDKLNNEVAENENKLRTLNETTTSQMWIADIDSLSG